MRIAIDDRKYSAIAENNQGYDITMMMCEWDESNWHWWAYQIKRLGLQGKVADALAKWDDDNSTGIVGRAVETVK